MGGGGKDAAAEQENFNHKEMNKLIDREKKQSRFLFDFFFDFR